MVCFRTLARQSAAPHLRDCCVSKLDEQGEVSFEYVEDADAVAKYGVNNKDIKAVGCYSQGQANRLGKWTLLSEQDLTRLATFQ